MYGSLVPFAAFQWNASDLEWSILSSSDICRFPTFSVGNLTRDSVRDALIRGITADQVQRGDFLYLIWYHPFLHINLYTVYWGNGTSWCSVYTVHVPIFVQLVKNFDCYWQTIRLIVLNRLFFLICSLQLQYLTMELLYFFILDNILSENSCPSKNDQKCKYFFFSTHLH